MYRRDALLGATEPCRRCDGCGQIASGDEGAPWSTWLNLPLQSSVAVLVGLVRPLPCPDCGGSGTFDRPDAQMSISEQCSRLRQFAQAVLKEWPEGAPDPWDLQDLASAAGLLRPETRREPCGEECNCAGYDDFPLVCYRRTALLTGEGPR